MRALLLLCGVASGLRLGAPVLRAGPAVTPTSAATPQPASRAATAMPSSPLALALGLAVLTNVEPAMASGEWAAPTKAALGPFLSLYTVLFVVRVVLSWFPKYDLNELPWNIAAWPTEPILKPTRTLIPPVAGTRLACALCAFDTATMLRVARRCRHQPARVGGDPLFLLGDPHWAAGHPHHRAAQRNVAQNMRLCKLTASGLRRQQLADLPSERTYITALRRGRTRAGAARGPGGVRRSARRRRAAARREFTRSGSTRRSLLTS